MRKTLMLALALILVLSFSACTYQPRKPVPNPTLPAPTTKGIDTTRGIDRGALKDGTYEGKGDRWEFGDESATVVISEGRIAQVTLKRLTAEGKELNYDEWTGGRINNQTTPNIKQSRLDLAKAIIVKQSTAVNDIAGATVSSKNWKLAVDRAIEQAEVK